MAGEKLIRILAEGKSLHITDFKNIEDITPDERKSLNGANQFKYSAQERTLNSAEKYNMKQRLENSKVDAYSISEFLSHYKTRNFKIWKMNEIYGIASYLASVMEYAVFILTNLKKVQCKEKPIQEEKNANVDYKFEADKIVVKGLLDLLLEIKTQTDDLARSDFSYYLTHYYEELDSHVRLILQTNSIPNEILPNINAIFPSIAVKAFNIGKEDGQSEEYLKYQFSEIVKLKLITSIKIFVTRLIEEFSPYFTSNDFLNNPEGDALFVVPLSIYKKFNFQKSGLVRSEIVFIDAVDSDKLIKFCKMIQQELLEIKNEAENTLSELHKTPEDKSLVCEKYVKQYEKIYAGKTAANMSFFNTMLKHPAFAEKFDALIQMRKDLVEPALKGINVWSEQAEDTVYNKNLDKNMLLSLYVLYRHYFGETDIPFKQCQVIRLLHMYSHCLSPEKSINRYVKKYSSGDCSLNEVRQEEFIKILDN
ncbi:MAG: hypothetical protein HUK25_10180 [Treponema sp.]|nr:hypothetical protein [Treponema sp.]